VHFGRVEFEMLIRHLVFFRQLDFWGGIIF
jgi:hypothetical protein